MHFAPMPGREPQLRSKGRVGAGAALIVIRSQQPLATELPVVMVVELASRHHRQIEPAFPVFVSIAFGRVGTFIHSANLRDASYWCACALSPQSASAIAPECRRDNDVY